MHFVYRGRQRKNDGTTFLLKSCKKLFVGNVHLQKNVEARGRSFNQLLQDSSEKNLFMLLSTIDPSLSNYCPSNSMFKFSVAMDGAEVDAFVCRISNTDFTIRLFWLPVLYFFSCFFFSAISFTNPR